MLEILFFTLVAAVAILSSILVVAMRNPINSALSLIMTFFCLATLYVMLDAPFMAAIQVIVYAGRDHGPDRLRHHAPQHAHGNEQELRSRGAGELHRGGPDPLRDQRLPEEEPADRRAGQHDPGPVATAGHTELIGKAMFSDFLLPFEITSILLLVAIVGSVILAKRKL